MSVGFTGSRGGLTPEQLLSLAALLRGLARGAVSFAHGDCRGADDQAARIALNLGLTVHVLPGPDGRDAGPWRHLGDDLYGRVTRRHPGAYDPSGPARNPLQGGHRAMGYFSNGTEGAIYEETYCRKCVHYGPEEGPGCPVWLAHLLRNYAECNNPDSILHLLIPMSKDGLSNEECTMFRSAA